MKSFLIGVMRMWVLLGFACVSMALIGLCVSHPFIGVPMLFSFIGGALFNPGNDLPGGY